MPSRKLAPFTAAGPRKATGQPLIEVPDAPEWMRPIAQRKFVEVCEYLIDLGSLTAGELPMVEMFATAYCHYVEAEMILANAPLTYRAVLNRQGEEASSVALPAAAQSAKAVDQMRRLGAALGLTPVERARLPVTRQADDEDECERLFRAAGVA